MELLSFHSGIVEGMTASSAHPSRRAALTLAGLSAVVAGCSSSQSDNEPAGPKGEEIAQVADIKEPTVVTTSAGKEVVISPDGKGSFVAFSGLCTHNACKVRFKDDVLDCPCHGSWFSPQTGEVKRGPATTPLPPVAIAVDGAKIVLA